MSATHQRPLLRNSMASFVGGPFDRPKTSHPVDHYAEREAHIAHLTVVLCLLRAREQARGQRAHTRQSGDLIGQFMHRDSVILGACHQEYVLVDFLSTAGMAAVNANMIMHEV